MEPLTRACGILVAPTEAASFNTLQARSTKATGSMIRLTAKVASRTRTGPSTVEDGSKICSKARALRRGLMAKSSKVSIQAAKRTDLDAKNGMMPLTTATGKPTRSVDSATTLGTRAASSLSASGRTWP